MPTTTPFNNLITFSRGSNATVTGPNGLIQWAPNNLLLQSESFDSSAWFKGNTTVTANAAVAPDGSTTADQIAFAAVANANIQPNPAVTVTAGLTYTFSVYVRASAAVSNVNLSLQGSDTLISIGTDWTRVSMTVTASGGTLSPTLVTRNSVASTIFAWGAQLELGSTATTYNSTTVKNLLGFSEAFDNAAWNKVSSSIVTGAQANPVNGLFNAQKLMEDTATSSHRVSLAAGTVGNPETLSVYAKPAGRSWINLTLGAGASYYFNVTTGVVGSGSGGSASIVSVGSGWYRCSVTATRTSNTNNLIYASADGAAVSYTGDGNSGVYIYGAHLSDSASLDPYVPTPGAAPSSTAFYGPRFDFDPVTLQPRGLLVEEQRTNIVTYSDQFNDPTWTKFLITVTANSTISPDGTTNADTIASTGGGSSALRQIMSTASGTHTATIYAKAGTKTVIQFSANAFSWGIDARANFDLASGVLGTVDAGLTATITNVGNGWYRCSVAATKAATAGALLWCIVDSPTSAREAATTAGTLFVWGAQLEAGAFATSYIPTVASTVTRSADVATITGQNFAQWYGPAAGTFVIDVLTAPGLRTGGGVQGLFSINDGTTSNVMNAARQATRVIRFNGTGSPAGDVSSVATAPDGTLAKVASAYAVNDWALSLNGATAVTDTSAVVPTVTRFGIGSLDGLFDPAAQWGGHIRNIRFIPARAADFQLQGLST